MNHLRDDPETRMRSPIHGDTPTGKDPRISPLGQANYRQLRDARSNARAEERRQEALEPDSRDHRVHSDWYKVIDLAQTLLSDVGKDVEVMVWLVEAETRLNGHKGLARSIGLIADLVGAYGDALHPHPEEPDDDRFATLAGLNGMGREGTLVQPLRLLPLVPGAAYGELSLWHVASGTGAEDVAKAIIEAGTNAMRARHADVIEAIRAIENCDRVLTDLLGGDAPPFGQLIDILDDTERTIRRLAALGELEPDPPAEEPASEAPDEAQPTHRETTTNEIASREQAFAELLRIAAYFRRTEPHSPTADALETLVRRGRMDFLSLIKELIPEDAARETAMKIAGIGQGREADTNEGT